jgi:hypothetical protein
VTPLPGLDDLEVGTSQTVCCWGCRQHSRCSPNLADTTAHNAPPWMVCGGAGLKFCVVLAVTAAAGEPLLPRKQSRRQ